MRIDYGKVAPQVSEAVMAMHRTVQKSGLDPLLLELVKTRASQINGCAFCLDMHTKDARARGETEQRLYMLPAWREAELYTERERAALAWCESVTLVSQTGAPDGVYEEVARCFSQEEIVLLTLAVCEINAWNRLSVAMRTPAGDYVSPYRPRP